jgi:hypothetical protein
MFQSGQLNFPPIEAARQVKMLFSLMGELVPNF